MKFTKFRDVLVRKHEAPQRWQFFANVMLMIQIAVDPDSFNFYQAEDWEILLSQTGQSPFSGRKIKGDNLDDSDDFENLLTASIFSMLSLFFNEDIFIQIDALLRSTEMNAFY